MTEKKQQTWFEYIKNKTLLLLLGSALLVALAVLIFVKRPIAVEVAVPEYDVPVTIFGLGTVEARVLSKIGFEAGATLTELNVDHGDHVIKGTVLARLHNAEQVARTAKARAGVANAEAILNMSQAVVKKARAVLAQRQQTNQRQQRLLTRNTVSKEAAEDAQLQEDVSAAELLVALSEVEVAKAKLADAQAQLEFEEVLLDHHILRAPYDAIVIKRHHEAGDVVNAGESIFTLIDATSVWALAYVDESRAGQIYIDQAAEVHLRSLPGAVFPGHVARIDIESDRVNEERRIYIECDQCPERFYLGEQAQVFITIGHLAEATLIPESSVLEFKGDSGTIWVVNEQHLQLREVEFGAKLLDGRLEISSGLGEGEFAVTVLRKGLRQGRRIKQKS